MLKLYVWKDFAYDYSGGLAVALASDEVEARALIEDSLGYVPSDWGVLSIHPLDHPFAAAVSGGM